MEQIAIIGGGIVGATAGYYLARAGGAVTLFDEGTGQATKAAAGIINPWFSLRRNKPWYHLVSQGAEFYRVLMADLALDGYPSEEIFEADGALMIRRTEKRYQQDLKQAAEKQAESPSIQKVERVDAHDLFELVPAGQAATYVQGGGRVDGARLIQILHQAIIDHGGTIVQERASWTPQDGYHLITSSSETIRVDKLLLAAGAWLPQLIQPHGYETDIFAQKGQLYAIHHDQWINRHWPVIMPPGTADIIPFNNGTMIIGATHENDQGYNLEPNRDQLEALRQEAGQIIPSLLDEPIDQIKVGTRAHTANFDVLVGKIPEQSNVWAVSGLGSSGLTSGPFLGHQWAQLVITGQWAIDEANYPIQEHIWLKQEI